jgi:chloramphenicol 3-O-phosphotransferase
LIVLTGPAAVGKSTVARALQKHLGRDGAFWTVMELDAFARGLPTDWLAFDRHVGRHAQRGLVYAPTESGGIELIVGADGRQLFAAFHRAVAATVELGVNVIAEAAIYDDEDRRDWSVALGDIDATWVRLTASVDELEARENANPSRLFRGLARGMSARAVARPFDVVADTGAESVDEIVRRIAEASTRTQGSDPR